MSRCASHSVHVAVPAITGTAGPKYVNGTREYAAVTPKDVPPPLIVFSSEALYCQFQALPKSQVLRLRPSLTPFAVKPAIPALTQLFGSLVKPRCRRWALSEDAHNMTIRNAREKRLIIILQVVLQLTRVAG